MEGDCFRLRRVDFHIGPILHALGLQNSSCSASFHLIIEHNQIGRAHV